MLQDCYCACDRLVTLDQKGLKKGVILHNTPGSESSSVTKLMLTVSFFFLFFFLIIQYPVGKYLSKVSKNVALALFC